MNLEDQVCSLELAKRLKELGVPQESLFYWHITTDGIMLNDSLSFFTCFKKYIETRDRYVTSGGEVFSAFTVAELGEELFKNYGSFISNVHGVETIDRNCEIKADTEANARAKMKIYLIENKLGGER
jgi:hypothetical protein